MNSIEELENIAITFDEGGYEPTTLGAKSGHFIDVFGDDFSIIEKDLERLEILEEEYNNLKKDYDNKDLEWCDLLKENAKLKQALDILKDKKVSIELLLKTDNFNQYNRVRHLYDASDYLTAEEYELLKEVLGNES